LPAEPPPLALVLAGRGLVLRTLSPVDPVPTPAEAIAAVLPGVNPAEFYCQLEATPAGLHLALVRRTVVDQLLAECEAVGLWVVACYLGPHCLTTLLPYLPETARSQPLVAGDFHLGLTADGQHLARVEYLPPLPDQPAAYALGAETLSTTQVLPYAAALTALVQPGETSPATASIPPVAARAAEWGQREWFLRLRLAVPVMILLLLLANLLISQHLLAESSQLAARLGNNQHLLQQLRGLQRTVGLKHAFLTSTGWAQPSWNSLCADRLAASMPAGLDLLVLDISPRQDPDGRAERQVVFQPNLVTVKGQCRDAQRLNQWLQLVTKLPWVRAVRDQNFTYDYAGGRGTFTFTLLIDPAKLLS
jgi:hypothetical protein